MFAAEWREARERASDLSDPHAPFSDKSFEYNGKHREANIFQKLDPDY